MTDGDNGALNCNLDEEYELDIEIGEAEEKEKEVQDLQSLYPSAHKVRTAFLSDIVHKLCLDLHKVLKADTDIFNYSLYKIAKEISPFYLNKALNLVMPFVLSEISGLMFETKEKLNVAVTYEKKAKTSFQMVQIIAQKYLFTQGNEGEFFSSVMLQLINRVYTIQQNSSLNELDRTEILFSKIALGLKANSSFTYSSLLRLINIIDCYYRISFEADDKADAFIKTDRSLKTRREYSAEFENNYLLQLDYDFKDDSRVFENRYILLILVADSKLQILANFIKGTKSKETGHRVNKADAVVDVGDVHLYLQSCIANRSLTFQYSRTIQEYINVYKWMLKNGLIEAQAQWYVVAEFLQNVRECFVDLLGKTEILMLVKILISLFKHDKLVLDRAFSVDERESYEKPGSNPSVESAQGQTDINFILLNLVNMHSLVQPDKNLPVLMQYIEILLKYERQYDSMFIVVLSILQSGFKLTSVSESDTHSRTSKTDTDTDAPVESNGNGVQVQVQVKGKHPNVKLDEFISHFIANYPMSQSHNDDLFKAILEQYKSAANKGEWLRLTHEVVRSTNSAYIGSKVQYILNRVFIVGFTTDYDYLRLHTQYMALIAATVSKAQDSNQHYVEQTKQACLQNIRTILDSRSTNINLNLMPQILGFMDIMLLEIGHDSHIDLDLRKVTQKQVNAEATKSDPQVEVIEEIIDSVLNLNYYDKIDINSRNHQCLIKMFDRAVAYMLCYSRSSGSGRKKTKPKKNESNFLRKLTDIVNVPFNRLTTLNSILLTKDTQTEDLLTQVDSTILYQLFMESAEFKTLLAQLLPLHRLVQFAFQESHSKGLTEAQALASLELIQADILAARDPAVDYTYVRLLNQHLQRQNAFVSKITAVKSGNTKGKTNGSDKQTKLDGYMDAFIKSRSMEYYRELLNQYADCMADQTRNHLGDSKHALAETLGMPRDVHLAGIEQWLQKRRYDRGTYEKDKLVVKHTLRRSSTLNRLKKKRNILKGLHKQLKMNRKYEG